MRLTKRVVDGAEPGPSDRFLWDSDVSGFGLKITPSGRKVYVLQYRIGGRSGSSRRYTIGRHGAPWTPETARKEAERLLGQVATGQDPSAAREAKKRELTVSALCDLYLAEGCATKKASTLATDQARIERHIKPLLGQRSIGELTRADVERFLQDVAGGKTKADVKTKKRGRAIVRGGKGTATRTVGLLGGILTFAVDRSLISQNPVRGVKRFPDRKGERFLSATELQRLGGALEIAGASGVNPAAIAAIRLLILTGCRRGEILGLRWEWVDFEHGCLRLPDSKTGAKIVPVGAPALELLAEVPRHQGSPYVFAATVRRPQRKKDGTTTDRVHRPEVHLVGLPRVWRQVCELAGLNDVRLHDLRHSFASVAAARGDSLLMIGKLLGHKSASTTQRYAHLAADPVKAAADRIAETIAASMKPPKGVVDAPKHVQVDAEE